MNKAQKALLTKGERRECKRINLAWGFMVKILRDVLGGQCEMCGGFDELSGHHILPKFLGGESTRTNTIMLCPNCHDRIHHRNGYFVALQ